MHFKSIKHEINLELEHIFQKGPYQMIRKHNRILHLQSLHEEWRKMSKNEAKISISTKESYTKKLFEMCDLLAKDILSIIAKDSCRSHSN